MASRWATEGTGRATCSTTTLRDKCQAICQIGRVRENLIAKGEVMHHGNLGGANDPVGSRVAEAIGKVDPRGHERLGGTLGQTEVCETRGATKEGMTILPRVLIAVGATVGRPQTHGRAIKERGRHMVQRHQDPSNTRVVTKSPDHFLGPTGRDPPTGAQMTPTTQRHGNQKGMRDQCQSHIPRPRPSSCTEHRPWKPP